MLTKYHQQYTWSSYCNRYLIKDEVYDVQIKLEVIQILFESHIHVRSF